MTTTTFDIAVRTLECSRCGAPIGAPLQGGETACRYCGATNVVRGRTVTGLRRTSSLSDEVARRSRLLGQLEHPVANSPYDLREPPAGWTESALLGPSGLQRLRREWNEAKVAAPMARLPEDQRRLVWLALRLAEAEHRSRNALASRAVLETALDLVPDEGHRHMVLCRMVTEAVRDRDLTSAAAWLAECDPAPEVLELDGAYREASGWLSVAKGDPQGALATLGTSAQEIPTALGFIVPLAMIRAHALETMLQGERAYAELETACKSKDAAIVVAAFLEAGLAPRTMQRKRRAELDALSVERNRLHVGARALGPIFALLPLLALALFIAVTIPRCVFDADPLLGAHGYALCPYACRGCTGPFRTYTPWEHHGGEHSTNGSRYFCRTTTNRVDVMPDAEMGAKLSALEPYELSVAPGAATYLILLFGAVPIGLVQVYRIHARAARRREELDDDMARLAAAIAEPMPTYHPAPALAAIGPGFLVFIAATVGPGILMLAELALR